MAAASKTKLVVVSPWATKCGIAEYTQALLSEFKQDDYDVRIYCDERTTDTTSDVYQPAWRLSDAKSMCKVLANEGCADADVVLVQHQPSLSPSMMKFASVWRTCTIRARLWCLNCTLRSR